MSKSIRLILIFLILGGFIATGCAALTGKSRSAASSNSKSTGASSKEEQKKAGINPAVIESLRDQNKQFLNQIKELKKQRLSDLGVFEERTQQMDMTISLLEKNIRDLEQKVAEFVKRPAANPAAPTLKAKIPERVKAEPETVTKQENPQRKLLKEFKTPEDSKAIEVGSLTGSGKIIPDTKLSPKKQSEPPIVSYSDFKNSETWEDPDLNPPVSPIKLSVLNGANQSYKQAFKSYSGQQYQISIQQFEQFLSRFPNDQNADNSQFWIGQAYFKESNYLMAEDAFRKVLRNYQHGDTKVGFKTPDAVLMLGKIYLKRKKPIRARYYFQHIIDNYAGSQSASKAKQEIKSLNKIRNGNSE